jgi:hypothetical protein
VIDHQLGFPGFFGLFVLQALNMLKGAWVAEVKEMAWRID